MFFELNLKQDFTVLAQNVSYHETTVRHMRQRRARQTQQFAEHHFDGNVPERHELH
jgi:hypothetical protein